MISRIVEMVLENNRLTNNISPRDSDRVCIIQVWEHLGFYLSDSQKDKFLNMTAPETIRRIRQKIQEQGKYPADKRIKQSRKIKGLVIQQNMPSANTKRTEQLFSLDDYSIKPKKYDPTY